MKTILCAMCDGRGEIYETGSAAIEDGDFETCPDCNGKGQLEEEEDNAACDACGSRELRYVGIESREPHGESFFDEGFKCLDCGATKMLPDYPPAAPPRDGDYAGALMRSIILAKNLDNAFRMGVALATPPAAKKEIA